MLYRHGVLNSLGAQGSKKGSGLSIQESGPQSSSANPKPAFSKDIYLILPSKIVLRFNGAGLEGPHIGDARCGALPRPTIPKILPTGRRKGFGNGPLGRELFVGREFDSGWWRRMFLFFEGGCLLAGL